MVSEPLTSAGKTERLPPGRRVYAVGDVHGRLNKLLRVHDHIRRDLAARPVEAPLLLHLGDLIDRGPESAGCIALLAAGPPAAGVPVVNLMGNHERMMLDALARRFRGAGEHWLVNGGEAALASWGVSPSVPQSEWQAAIPEAHIAFIHALAPYHEQDGCVFVHAGVRPGLRLSRQHIHDLLWIREGFLDWPGTMLPERPDRIIVHGHTPAPEPEVRPNRIGIDTGAGKDGPLTCAVLEGRDVRFLQAV